MTSAATKVAVIIGGGSKHDKGGQVEEVRPESRWGIGGSLGLRFAAGGLHVALLSRRLEVMDLIAAEIVKRGGQATSFQCDVTSDDSVKAAFDAISKLGEVSVVIYNVAAPFPPGVSFENGISGLPTPLELDPAQFQFAFDCGVTGLLRCIKEFIPGMLERKSGKIILSGATMALRGGARFSFWAPSKTALRSFGQSLFQEYAPQGIHTSHVVIDGVIESPNTASMGNLMDPWDIAEQYWHLYTQPPCVWSYELQITPFTSGVGMRM
mmetsp:Transcript_70/g.197  ORF Transcript_70/g.197 Transcript_70/m.197 type:complete len:267 (+) Transcript_70:62-862(+)